MQISTYRKTSEQAGHEVGDAEYLENKWTGTKRSEQAAQKW